MKEYCIIVGHYSGDSYVLENDGKMERFKTKAKAQNRVDNDDFLLISGYEIQPIGNGEKC